ncbi:uncharacterized protein LOC110228160 isoform X2 [Arabidopsis lyrata subsp. lyrata]|uniref:uncharacterized protein LOC110228160 isoform X2 n=1 Tax=Arabidopsis lyrata subsp. lyrata TaxID=81972 RepID=UPI000A29E3D6|nr:uncharacterized protein LOC110228160 isoform X2 [Arabidopsis lyrata subsp. lyrata]|eukprot:XP_020880274.1 uncharacterized protein LOC110228160 isoform X2 [Arabidopsis lyrata subsp. lyrata]
MPNPTRNWDETSSGVSMPDPPRNWDENTIFWDVEDWSILKDLDPELVVEKTFSHLNDRGYLRSDTSIEAFFDDDIPDNLLYAYESSGMVHLPVAKGNKHARLHRMTVYILIWAHNHRPRPSNLFILSENIKEDKQVASVVKSLNEKPFYNVVLVDSRSLLADCRLSPTKEWICDCCGDPFKKTYFNRPRPPRTPLTSPGVAVYRSARKSPSLPPSQPTISSPPTP